MTKDLLKLATFINVVFVFFLDLTQAVGLSTTHHGGFHSIPHTLCGICGGQSDTGIGVFSEYRVRRFSYQ